MTRDPGHPGDDDETTFVIPTPGGRSRGKPAPTFADFPAPAPAPPPPRPAPAPEPQPAPPLRPQAVPPRGAAPELPSWGSADRNPLLAPAAALLALATRVRTLVEQPDVRVLREKIVEAMRRFEKQALATGIDQKVLRVGHYALCAFIDDMVLNTPWGAASPWAKQSIVSTFHVDVVGGDRFYDLLKQLQQDPGRFGPVLELMYLCLSLGFEGRMRVLERGPADHARVRDGVYATIRQLRGDYERELSPRWRGLSRQYKPLAAGVPLWVAGVVAAALLTTAYLGFSFALQSHSDTVSYQVATLPPEGAVDLTVAPPPEAKPVAPEVKPPPGPSAAVVKMRRFLEKEISEGLVDVSETRQVVTVRLVGDGMFDSGSDAVRSSYLPTLERVSRALNDEPGDVLITGHTDNVQIRRSLRFQSNFDLSVARANAVKTIIVAQIANPGRVRTEGKGEFAPIGDNRTDEGRRKNRRIELLLVKTEGAAP